MVRAFAGVRSTSETVRADGEGGVFVVDEVDEGSEPTVPEHAPSPMAVTAVRAPSPTVRVRQFMNAPVRSLVEATVLAWPLPVRVLSDN